MGCALLLLSIVGVGIAVCGVMGRGGDGDASLLLGGCVLRGCCFVYSGCSDSFRVHIGWTSA